MHSDRIRAIRRARAENSRQGIPRIIARNSLQDGAIGAIQPGQDPELIVGGDVGEAGGEAWIEDEGSGRRALVSLPGRRRAVAERRFHEADGVEFKVHKPNIQVGLFEDSDHSYNYPKTT